MRAHVFAFVAVVAGGWSCGPQPSAPVGPTVEVFAVLKNDLAFAFYPLAGASQYGVAYRDRYADFWGRFGPALPASVTPGLEAMRQLKEQQGFLFGSSFARLFQRLDADTIAGLVAAIEADDAAVLAEVDSWGPGVLELYLHGGFKPTVAGVLRALEAANFPDWWATTAKPTLDAKVAALEAYGLGDIAIKPELARWSGRAPKDGPVRLNPVYFMMSQGQQVMFADRPGLTYLMDFTWGEAFVALQLVHEVSHNQLLDWSDPAVKAAAATLASDPAFAAAFEAQKVVSGYVLVDDFIEENVTEGAQMVMAVDLGIAVEPRAYLRTHDGGSHVLSAAMLQLMKQTGWAPGGTEHFQAWFLRQVSTGALGPGTIQPLRDQYLSP